MYAKPTEPFYQKILVFWKYFLKRSRDERLTIMLVPHTGSNGLSFHINYLHIYYFLLLISIYLLLSFFTYSHTSSVREKEKVLRLSQIKDSKIISGYQKQYQVIGAHLYNIQLDVEDIYDVSDQLPKRVSYNIKQVFGSRSGNWFEHLFEKKEIKLQELKYKLLATQKILHTSRKFLHDYPHFDPDNISLYPVDGYLVRGYNLSIPHVGLDIAAPRYTPIHAAASGKVSMSEWIGGYGNAVEIVHRNGMRTIYGHNSRNLVHPGQWVEKGEVVALVGSTGISTGNHVHFEIRRNNHPIDPLPFVKFFIFRNRVNPRYWNTSYFRQPTD